ncbi:Glycosyl transferase family 2 [Pseudovibrio axinellae]|uniref:Glycosyl transferase family 2 n=1 Tax=Pseudovibrio axinellae TaxID=989403 RepID=A0A165W293_9HYPH|nr:glycosyltransferase family 2 protein [Pseudovibrio axinellae]KZL15858.1 Glycosyl transferase family 2 [Pseudovibrio axinellae]SER83109.1 Glycosyltransferase involved in cell wall bisynthesis [Pseudovibrio axinellae]
MSIQLPVSVFIITKDEQDRIRPTINSVKDWVDEVIVVDSGSTDNTVSLAEQAGAKVFFNEWDGYGKQKRYAEDQCKNTWLLNIDADEEITPKLAEEIKKLFAPVPSQDIYKVHIVDVFPHELTAKKWAYGYWQYRLYNKEKGRFSTSSVHDTVRPYEGSKIAKLRGKVDHRSQRSLQFSVEKFNRYSDMQVQDMIDRGRTISSLRLLTEFPIAFMKSYILRRGFIYGGWGIVDAYCYAFSRFIRIAKFYQHQLIEKSKKER